MTFETSQLQSLNIASGNKTINAVVKLPGGSRHTLGVKNTATGIDIKWVSPLTFPRYILMS